MPSDSKKKKEQQKKDARKKKDLKKPKQQQLDGEENDENDSENEVEEQQEGQETSAVAANGIDSETTTGCGVNDGAAGTASGFGKIVVNGESVVTKHIDSVDEIEQKLRAIDLLDKQNADNRACTGVLSSHPHGRDVHIDLFSLTFYGVEILVDAKLELNAGRRYGILGLNGCGKSTMLSAISHREVPIPK
jgi:ATP-binding cassette subfamily F protein 2